MPSSDSSNLNLEITMSAPIRVVLFDSNASPQTGVVSGNSNWFEAWDSDNDGSAPIPVTFFASGTFTTSSIAIQISDGGSPNTAVPAQALDGSDGTLADLAITAAGSVVVHIPQGAQFRAVLTEGSPNGAIKLTARGQVKDAP